MLDKRMIALFKAIDETGSINQAAKQAGLSYKGAWQMINRANLTAPIPLIITTTGGKQGGGTCLTVSGKELLKLFNRLEGQYMQFLLQMDQYSEDS